MILFKNDENHCNLVRLPNDKCFHVMPLYQKYNLNTMCIEY